MISRSNAGKQIQSYLPGLAPTAAEANPPAKEPHQMSPEEFAAAPTAVFHTSHLAPEDVKNMELRKRNAEVGGAMSPHIHVGSEQAALENSMRTESNPDITTPARMHVFWYQAQKRDPFTVHGDGNVYTRRGEEYIHDDHPFPALFYANKGEDYDSTSISVADPTRLKSQSDFVRDAIAAGKADEVHPITMAMFKEGHLDRGAYIPPGTGRSAYLNAKKVNNVKGQILDPSPMNLGPYALRNWTFPYEPNTEAHRVSDNGPDLDTIKKNAIRKPKKR